MQAWRMFDRQATAREKSRAFPKAGINIDTSIAPAPMTTSVSVKVNAFRKLNVLSVVEQGSEKTDGADIARNRIKTASLFT